jgi:hypothetical protein
MEEDGNYQLIIADMVNAMDPDTSQDVLDPIQPVGDVTAGTPVVQEGQAEGQKFLEPSSKPCHTPVGSSQNTIPGHTR